MLKQLNISIVLALIASVSLAAQVSEAGDTANFSARNQDMIAQSHNDTLPHALPFVLPSDLYGRLSTMNKCIAWAHQP